MQSCRDGGSSLGHVHAFTGDQCDKKDATSTPTRSSPPSSGPSPRDGDTISAANGTPPERAVVKWGTKNEGHETEADGGSGASLPAPAQAPDTLRFPLSGSLPCAKILEQDAAAWKPDIGPSVPLSPTPRQRCTLPLEDDARGAAQPITVKKSRVARCPRNGHFRPSGLQTTAAPSSSEKRSAAAPAAAAAAAFDPRCATPGFTVSGYIVPEPVARHKPAKPEREIDHGPDGPGNEASATGAADRKHQPLFDDLSLSSDQSIRVPLAPSCRPPTWEDPSDSVARDLVEQSSNVTQNARKRHRQGPTAAVPASAVASENRRVLPGWTPPTFGIGSRAGTAAAVAAKDVQNVMPTIPIRRAMMKPCLVADLVDMVSRSPPSPSPPTTCGRAFGVISPPSWSAEAGIGRLLATPRTDSGLCLPRAAVAPSGQGQQPSRNGSGVPIASSSSAFFPVRPRAGRRTPVLAGRARCLRAEDR